jgi:hypothetical protein
VRRGTSRKQKLTVRWRPDRTSQDEIERAVAKAGHDTENFLADDETHANLHTIAASMRGIPDLLKKNKRHDETIEICIFA